MRSELKRDLTMLSPVIVFLVLTLAYFLSVPRPVMAIGAVLFMLSGVLIWAVAIMQAISLDLPRREKLIWLAVSILGSLPGTYLFYFALFRHLPNNTIEPTT